MRGRKPIPTPLKLITGNPGKRRLNDSEPVAPPLESLQAPSWLAGVALVVWGERAPQLQTMGLLRGTDVELFAGFCQAYAAAVLASQEGRDAVKLWGLVRSLGSEFGLSPASRTRLHVRPDADRADSIDEFVRSKRG